MSRKFGVLAEGVDLFHVLPRAETNKPLRLIHVTK